MKRVALLSLLVLSVSCSNEKLVPVQEELPGAVDDLLEIETTFCTRPPEEVIFPVKILLVVDTSGSMQFTDQPGLRVNAVRELMNSLASRDDVFVATMGFGSNIYLEPPIAGPGSPMYVPASQWVEPTFLSLKDVNTDYHGAFAAVQQHLVTDFLNTAGRADGTGSAELARSKYIVLFFSDGAPQPRCCIGADETVGVFGPDVFDCAPEGWEVETAGVRYCENQAEISMCNDSEDLDFFRDNYEQINNTVGGTNIDTQESDYGAGVIAAVDQLEVDGNYNRTYQIQALVEDIMEFGQDFGVGQIQINTALLFDPELPDPIKEIIAANRCRAAGLLESIAEIGEGQFRDFQQSDEIDFLSFNFTALNSGSTLISTYAHNLNALPPGGDPQVIEYRADSDGDGIDDEVEFLLGTSAIAADSDQQSAPAQPDEPPIPPPGVDPNDPNTWGDGLNDKIEHDREAIGFDPRFTQRPLTACPVFDPTTQIDRRDLDGDGLNGCEENAVGTSRRLADTDGDTLPDGIEVRLGLDPTIAESDSDDDFDGVPNLEEARRSTDPLVPDADRDDEAIRYELIETGRTEDGRTCYSSITRGLHLATTEPRFTGGRRGYNDVLVWIAEAPDSNPTGRVDLRVACVRVQYIKPSFKDPLRGKVFLVEDDFYDLNSTDDLQFFTETPLTEARDANGTLVCRNLEVR